MLFCVSFLKPCENDSKWTARANYSSDDRYPLAHHSRTKHLCPSLLTNNSVNWRNIVRCLPRFDSSPSDSPEVSVTSNTDDGLHKFHCVTFATNLDCSTRILEQRLRCGYRCG